MTGQHFKELLETICKTKKIPQVNFADFIGVKASNLTTWKRTGLCAKRSSIVSKQLRDFMAA